MKLATFFLLLPCLLWCLLATEVGHAETTNEAADRSPWRVTERRNFDERNFTQGLEIHDGVLWVSSGLYGQSAVRRYDLDSGQQLSEHRLPRQFFAEGLTKVGDELFLLTWRARKLLVFDAESLQVKRAMTIPGEGWGITHQEHQIWFSDGSDTLWHFDHTQTQPQLNRIQVTLDGSPLPRLNELEWINGEIWANVWQTDQIARIDPTTGRVTGLIDLSVIYPRAMRPRGADVLNGIARDPLTNTVWVTGKRWPVMFAIAPPSTNSD